MNNILIDLYVMHWNEEKIVPLIMNYWDLLPLRKIFIIDNESTDNSLNLIKNKFQDKVEIITYKSNNEFDDINHMRIKNNIWKQYSIGKVDFVIISDFDEVVYHDNLINELQYMKDNDYSILNLTGVDLYFKEFPQYSDKLLHTYNDCRFLINERYGKLVLFNPNLIESMQYDVGQHYCKPVGTVKIYNCNAILFHAKNLSAEYISTRNNILGKRLSALNNRFKLGFHYLKTIDEAINEFNVNYEKTTDNFK